VNATAGYIGLGKMGKAMAINALRAGFEVHAYDIRKEPVDELLALGGHAAASPREIAARCGLIAVVVWDDAQVREVMEGHDGILAGATAGSVILLHTTIHPSTARNLADETGRRGVGIVDAQMSGGQVGAENRRLCFMVGGDKTAFDRCSALLASSAADVFHVGALGAGSTMKLVQQTILCLNRLAACEGMRLAGAYGLDAKLTQEVLSRSFAQSYVVDNWLQRFAVREDDPASVQSFALVLHTILPALELARELGIDLPAAALAVQMFPQKQVAAAETGAEQ
jgi:3-hydroxyisobutyrate dehydrogenase-like beta-hydroxyacid dehydrogenase